MSINRFEELANIPVVKEPVKEPVMAVEVETQSKPKPKKERSSAKVTKNEKWKTKPKTYSMYPILHTLLHEQRLNNAPALSDSQYAANMITMDRFKQNLFDPRTGQRNEEVFHLLEQLEND